MSLFVALIGAAAVTVEQPIDGQTGVWVKQGATVISSGMSMVGAVISSGQTQYVYNRGAAKFGAVSSAGRVYVSNGGTLSSVDLGSGAYVYVSSGGLASNIHARGTAIRTEITIFAGGAASDATISGGATLYAYSGGAIFNVTLMSGTAYLTVRGGSVGGATISGGTAFVSSGSIVSGAVVYGRMIVSSGGTALAVTSNAGALVNVLDGGYIEYA